MFEPRGNLKLDNGSRIAVIGSGPAGSLFSFFLLDMAERIGIDVQLDLFDHKDFSRSGPASCNMCGGIISESLVQMLATEGINLPSSVVQRGLNSYVLHMDVGTQRIDTPLQEKRIAAVHRGGGPRGAKDFKWTSFDGHLQGLAIKKGAEHIKARVDELKWQDGRLLVKTKDGEPRVYDLVVVSAGINTTALKLVEGLEIGYQPPQTTKTAIRELFLGEKLVNQFLGSSMHVFLLDIPRLQFAALIPKGNYVTMCLLGHDIDNTLVESFLSSPQVKASLPVGWQMLEDCCHCFPSINIRGAVQPFADRVVFIGDSGVSRLYKDGIGAAYRTAKAAAKTAVFEGISSEDFRRHYWPVCKMIARDNSIGKIVFAVTHLIQKVRFARKGILRMLAREQSDKGSHKGMSTVLWDTFTGSAPYKDVFLRTLQPHFLAKLTWHAFGGLFSNNFTNK